MPVTRIAIDGLWRCLCPSIDAIASSQLRLPLQRNSARPSLGRKKSALSRPRRRLSSQNTATATGTEFQDRQDAQVRTKERKDLAAELSPERGSLPYTSLDDVSIKQLHEYLGNIRMQKNGGGYKKTAELVAYLVKERGEKPSVLHYDALIRANADASFGAADDIGNLLRELKEEGIVPDSGLYHSALQVCLRSITLEYSGA